MALSADAAALFFATVFAVLQLVIVFELVIHHKYNGPILLALQFNLVAFVVIVAFPITARMDALADLSPGWDLRAVLASSVWAAYAVACVPAVYLWWALHTEHRRKR